MRFDPKKKLSAKDLETPIQNFLDPYKSTLQLEQSAEQALHTIREKKKSKPFYVVDKEDVLQGTITLETLVYSDKQTPIGDLIEGEIVKICGTQTLEKGLALMAANHLIFLAVVDEEDHFLGVIHLEAITETNSAIQAKKVREDLFQFIGFSLEQRKKLRAFPEYKLRMPWLLCNLVGGLICAVISELFQLTLVEYVILAFFIPLVLTLSESISIQSMTLSLRFIHLRHIHWAQVARRLILEARTSLLLGLSSALLLSAFYFAWSVEIWPVVGIGVSIVFSMFLCSIFGALFPILLHAIRLDPKVAAGPVVLMVADVLTITIYLSVNTLLLM